MKINNIYIEPAFLKPKISKREYLFLTPNDGFRINLENCGEINKDHIYVNEEKLYNYIMNYIENAWRYGAKTQILKLKKSMEDNLFTYIISICNGVICFINPPTHKNYNSWFSEKISFEELAIKRILE